MKLRMFKQIWPVAILPGALLLSGCQLYHAKPLPTAADLLQAPPLTVPAKQFGPPEFKPHPSPTNGLDEMAVITLAVYNNPDLKSARADDDLADAQVMEAGLLPDPVVSGGLAKSTMFTGYNIGLSEDIQALITRGAAKASAKAHARQVNLEILWQEWQVIEKARELFIQSIADDELQRVLTDTHDLLADRYHRDEAALEQGNETTMTVSADLSALTDAESNLRQLQLDANQTHHDLNQLLGLQPDVQLHLIGQAVIQPVSQEQFQAAMATLPRRRADLLALQAGYQSQEQLLREAVLAQFPSMSAGVEQARDPAEGIRTIGLTVNVTLPIFNRNQGQIAIQKATREQLYQAYQTRLDQTVSEADQMWQATQIMSAQLQDVEAHLLTLENNLGSTEKDFQQGSMDAASYITVKSNLDSEKAQAIRLRATLKRAQAALQILLGRNIFSETK